MGMRALQAMCSRAKALMTSRLLRSSKECESCLLTTALANLISRARRCSGRFPASKLNEGAAKQFFCYPFFVGAAVRGPQRLIECSIGLQDFLPHHAVCLASRRFPIRINGSCIHIQQSQLNHGEVSLPPNRTAIARAEDFPLTP